MDDLSLRIRAYALSLPGAEEHFPWGERVMKVKGKVFVFLGEGQGFAVKLPQSGPAALAMPGNKPTGYNLGKAGWVSVNFADGAGEDQLRAWVLESWRAVAPKRLAASYSG